MKPRVEWPGCGREVGQFAGTPTCFIRRNHKERERFPPKTLSSVPDQPRSELIMSQAGLILTQGRPRCNWTLVQSLSSRCTEGPVQGERSSGMKSIVVSMLIVCLAVSANAAKKYSYFRVGNANDVTTTTTPGTMLMGGSTDVDAAFVWMCRHSGNGDFLVIRATGTDAYNPYIQQLCPSENSVATLIIPNLAAANDPAVAGIIDHPGREFRQHLEPAGADRRSPLRDSRPHGTRPRLPLPRAQQWLVGSPARYRHRRTDCPAA